MLKLRKVHDVKQVPWQVPRSAYFTGGWLQAVPNPFVKRKQTDDESIWKTPLKNQLIMRGSKVVGIGLQTTGTALLAESVRRQTVPVQHRYERFSYMPKSYQPAGMKPDPKTKHARRGLTSRPEYAQEEKFWKQRKRAEARYVKTPRVAGASLILGGRVLPVMAVGYVGYNLLTGQSIEHQKPLDPWGASDIIMETPGMLETLREQQIDVLQFGGTLGSGAIDWAQGAAARALGFAVLQGILG